MDRRFYFVVSVIRYICQVKFAACHKVAVNETHFAVSINSYHKRVPFKRFLLYTGVDSLYTLQRHDRRQSGGGSLLFKVILCNRQE